MLMILFLLSTAKTLRDLELKCSSELKVFWWSKSNLIKLNLNKTQCLLFRNRSDYQLNVKFEVNISGYQLHVS